LGETRKWNGQVLVTKFSAYEQDFGNCEVKVFTFASSDDDEAALVAVIEGQ
jgi:hypothetical protein